MARAKKEQAAPTDAESNGAPPEKTMSQREAVRLAMRAKGKNASNDVLMSYIHDELHMTLKKQNVATLKSQIKAEGRRSSTGAPKGTEGFTLEDLRLVQDLIARIGGKRVRDMVELFDQ